MTNLNKRIDQLEARSVTGSPRELLIHIRPLGHADWPMSSASFVGGSVRRERGETDADFEARVRAELRVAQPKCPTRVALMFGSQP